MLPGSVLSSTPEPGTFLAPRNFLRDANNNNLLAKARGGIAVGDGTQGLNYQNWTAVYDGANLVLTPDVGTPYTVLVIPSLVWFDFTFDQSMRPVVAYALLDGTSHFYWYDTTISAYRTTDLPVGTDPWPYACFDDTRSSQTNAADVIIAYTRSGNLYFLAQRDRFGVEYNLGSVGTTKVMTQVGPTTVNRFQFQFNQIIPDPVNLFTKYVPAPTVNKALVLGNVGAIKPRVWAPVPNNLVRSRS